MPPKTPPGTRYAPRVRSAASPPRRAPLPAIEAIPEAFPASAPFALDPPPNTYPGAGPTVEAFLYGQIQNLAGAMNSALLPTAGPVLVDHSGVIAVGGIAQSLLPANANRGYFFLQNHGPTDLWFNYTTAAVTAQPSIRLPVNAVYESPSHPSPEAVSVVSVTTGAAFTCKEQ